MTRHCACGAVLRYSRQLRCKPCAAHHREAWRVQYDAERRAGYLPARTDLGRPATDSPATIEARYQLALQNVRARRVFRLSDEDTLAQRRTA